MMPTRRRWTLIGMIVGVVSLVLAMFAMLFVQLQTGRRIDVRQTSHRQHLLFATQLRDDGSLDYHARIAELYAMPLEPDLNFVIALRAVAPENADPALHDYPADRTVAHPTLAPKFVSEFHFWQIPGVIRFKEANSDSEVVDAKGRWLDYIDPALDFLAVESRRRPHFGNPSEAEVDASTAISLPAVRHQDRQALNGISFATGDRSFRRVENGFLRDAWEDAQTINRYAVYHQQGPTIWHYESAYMSRCLAIGATIRILNSPRLTAELFAQIQSEVGPFFTPLLPRSQVDLEYRASKLELFDRFVQGESEDLGVVHYPGAFLGVVYAERINQLVDQYLVALCDIPDDQVLQSLDARAPPNTGRIATPGQLLGTILPFGKTQVDVTQELVDYVHHHQLHFELLSVGYSRLAMATQENILAVVLAIRSYEFENGRLPQQLTDLLDRLDPKRLHDPLSRRQADIGWQSDFDGTFLLTHAGLSERPNNQMGGVQSAANVRPTWVITPRSSPE